MSAETKDAPKDAVNPEEVKKDGSDTSKLVKGMRELDVKNIVVNMESKSETWVSLGVPSEIEQGLAEMSYFKPSIIQAKSIPIITSNPG